MCLSVSFFQQTLLRTTLRALPESWRQPILPELAYNSNIVLSKYSMVWTENWSTLNLLSYSKWSHNLSIANVFRGISSNGRAPALHAGGTGIDTRILQGKQKHFCYSWQYFADPFFLFGLIYLMFTVIPTQVECHVYLNKTEHCTTVNLLFLGTRRKVLARWLSFSGSRRRPR